MHTEITQMLNVMLKLPLFTLNFGAKECSMQDPLKVNVYVKSACKNI